MWVKLLISIYFPLKNSWYVNTNYFKHLGKQTLQNRRLRVVTALLHKAAICNCLTPSKRYPISFFKNNMKELNKFHNPLFSDLTCDATILGTWLIAGSEWSDEMCALIHGPVTGVRIWASTYVNLWVKATYLLDLDRYTIISSCVALLRRFDRTNT